MKRYTLPIVLFGPVLVLALLAGRALADTPAPALDLSLIDLAFRGIAEGNWFLVAGPVLAVVVYFARPVLGWRWPSLETSDRWGVAITAVLAGAGALAHAWIADEPLTEATTLLGALKVFVTAVASYVITKRVFAPKTPAPPSSGPTSTPPPKNGGAIGLVSFVLLVLLVGCGASAREKTIRTTYTGVVALHAAFTTWDLQHQRELTSGAQSVAEALARLDAYKAKRQLALDAFDATIHALAAAAILNDDPKSLPGAIAAAKETRSAVCAVTGPVPVLCPGGTP